MEATEINLGFVILRGRRMVSVGGGRSSYGEPATVRGPAPISRPARHCDQLWLSSL